MHEDKLMVIGDDVTGANDTGVMFADGGYSTILHISVDSLNHADMSSAQIFAVSTGCRALYDQAASKTASAVQVAIEHGVNRIYLKIDSTMRGSVAQQIDGALKEWSKLHADAKVVVCPAYPVMGRTIENGHLYVNGVPVCDTPSGQDRICPVSSSDMCTLIPGAVSVPSSDVAKLKEAILNSQAKVIVPDASSEEDLARIAEAIQAIGPQIIPTGSAGLASKIKLAKVSQSECTAQRKLGKALILLSTIHSTSEKQLDYFLSSKHGADTTVFIPANVQITGDESYQEHLRNQLKALLSCNCDFFVIKSNPTGIDRPKEEMTQLSQSIAKNLAALTLYALNTSDFDSVIIFGGDGASAFLEQAGITELRLNCSVMPGVPMSTAVNGQYKGLQLITKSGGFGKEDLFDGILSNLSN